MRPGPGPGAGGSVLTPHQPRRGGRGGIAPAAASPPAASPAPTGQERSPRPPSGCGGQFSGVSARGPAQQTSHSSRSPRSSVTSTSGAFLLQPPSTNQKKKNPFGGALESPRKASWGAVVRRVRDGPTGWHAVLRVSSSPVPNAPRAKGRSGGPLTTENPRHGRSRLCGARDGARTCVCGRVTEPRRPRRSPGAHACQAEAAASPGGGGWDFFFFFTRFFRGSGGRTEAGGGSSQGKRRGVVSWPPRRSRHLTDPARWASGGHSVPRNSGPGRSASPGQRSLPVLRPSCSTAEMPANAKIGNCFSGTFTATVAVPYPG